MRSSQLASPSRASQFRSNRDDASSRVPGRGLFGSNLNRLAHATRTSSASGQARSVDQSHQGLTKLSNTRKSSVSNAASTASGILRSRTSVQPAGSSASGVDLSAGSVSYRTASGVFSNDPQAEIKPQFDVWGRPVRPSGRQQQQQQQSQNAGATPSQSVRQHPASSDPSPNKLAARFAAAYSHDTVQHRPTDDLKKARQNNERVVHRNAPRQPALFDPASGSFTQVDVRTLESRTKTEVRSPARARKADSSAFVRNTEGAASSRSGDDSTSSVRPKAKENVKHTVEHDEAKTTPAVSKVDNRIVGAPGAIKSTFSAPTGVREAETAHDNVIHLDSYEDRNRGGGRTTTGQRMLYDPRSGALVAVKAKGETPGGRGKKEKKKSRQNRDRDTKLETASNLVAKIGADKQPKSQKDDNVDTTADSNIRSGKKNRRATNRERKFPRTCGVKYSRDHKGAFYCIDGCDGDLGYGSHSVPGGRTKNADAHAEFMELVKQHNSHEGMVAVTNAISGFAKYDDTEGFASSSELAAGTEGAVKRPERFSWVHPSEKIDLVTGVDGSPTLQATAREWAPGLSMFAAPTSTSIVADGTVPPIEQATGRDSSMPALDEVLGPNNNDENSRDAIQHDEQETDAIGQVGIDEARSADTNEVDYQLGLGFDPHSNMDSMMQSPSLDPAPGLDDVNFSSLTLQPTAFKSPSNAATSSNIFAFESGMTWGASGSTGADIVKSTDWSVPSTTGDNAFAATPLLGFPSSPWSSTTITGFQPTAFDRNSQNRD